MAAEQPTQEEMAAHRKRQQEFEEAARHIQTIIDNIRHDPMTLHKITVRGASKTRESFMYRILQPTFEARSLHEVIGLSRQAVRRMERFGIFDDVKLQLDSPNDPWLADRKDLVDLGIWVKESSRLQIRTGTEAGNAEASMYGAMTLKNVFGGAETLSTSMAFGTRTSSAFQFTLATPVLADPDKNLSVNFFSQARNNTQWSSYEEELKGTSLKYTTISPLGYHELAYEGHWREVCRPSEKASLSIREQCGHSLKSALTHMWIHDMRDEPLMPSTGHLVRVIQEYAGLGGDVNHLRQEVEAQIARSNDAGYILSATVKSGYLHSLNGKKSKISDRFFLGGPMSVRGFKSNGLGPREGDDSLGGDAYVSAGVSLLTPFPGLTTRDSFKAHVFANAGTLVSVEPGQSAMKTVNDLTKIPSVSVGAGIVYRHPQVRIELNFALPLIATKSDAISRGWQLGLGINFL
ncbi:surface antigen-domain-containing protein [Lobosporangium transversale]|uniref:Surface antigen-domain-containing protein n=1 Tax=Lobosporangium transversale TaxID=64571 RepID=A0A1Y2GVI2_9FUNG|nr:surface antigen-domain-containing protein [Lobosporangium transversale]ORZ26300.1 surface antigen-domain-containing protein [Lobosporangium transversale]|eukprot:XP_021884065.1 surface antigen-domain-containing protein [Lobosporangium transversale]